MKKLFNLTKIHDNKKYESQLFELNINSQFYEDIIKHSTICRNADIKECYINVPVQFKNILFVLKQRIYIDNRTNLRYDHVEKLNGEFSYYINIKDYQDINDDIIRHFEEFKPLGDERFLYYDDHYNLYKHIIGEE